MGNPKVHLTVTDRQTDTHTHTHTDRYTHTHIHTCNTHIHRDSGIFYIAIYINTKALTTDVTDDRCDKHIQYLQFSD